MFDICHISGFQSLLKQDLLSKEKAKLLISGYKKEIMTFARSLRPIDRVNIYETSFVDLTEDSFRSLVNTRPRPEQFNDASFSYPFSCHQLCMWGGPE